MSVEWSKPLYSEGRRQGLLTEMAGTKPYIGDCTVAISTTTARRRGIVRARHSDSKRRMLKRQDDAGECKEIGKPEKREVRTPSGTSKGKSGQKKKKRKRNRYEKRRSANHLVELHEEDTAWMGEAGMNEPHTHLYRARTSHRQSSAQAIVGGRLIHRQNHSAQESLEKLVPAQAEEEGSASSCFKRERKSLY
ncbi:hypothetical protein PIB30_094231 [Stylosanthes scabra]|uniref:Uncharacterized protein n=1 Tax=Stylosanthes scabra TaxID=79078 RepID=A0ABU6SW68_9FABA|nr:hypothetical protein [Stylosanthes scabra]